MASSEVPPAQKSVVADAVRSLERELETYRWRRLLRFATTLGVLALLVGAGFLWRAYSEPAAMPRFSTKVVEKRDIEQTVESTGKLRPLKEVQVGAQVSGRVVKVHVDFNSKVKEGQLLAEIDPSLFGAQVSQVVGNLEAAKASLLRANASAAAATTRLSRVKRLVAENVATQAELEEAQSTLDLTEADQRAAKAQIQALSAQLKSANTTLKYTKILSPIDGVVVNRAIDPGQTVASSFSAPVLFVIAQDLSKMQVLADIDEADVGKLSEGLEAEVRVDAFPGETFKGIVSQIRYSPNEVQGVVTYSAVVDVDNPDLKLRPGMTATVSVVTAKVNNVLAVPNSALRFRPVETEEEEDDDDEAPSPPPKVKEKEAVSLKHGQGRVYRSEGPSGSEEAIPLIIDLGLSDGVWTEIKTQDLSEGDTLITSQKGAKRRRKFLGIF